MEIAHDQPLRLRFVDLDQIDVPATFEHAGERVRLGALNAFVEDKEAAVDRRPPGCLPPRKDRYVVRHNVVVGPDT